MERIYYKAGNASGVKVVTAKEAEASSTEEFFLPSTIEYLFACDEIKNGEYSDKQAEEVYCVAVNCCNAHCSSIFNILHKVEISS